MSVSKVEISPTKDLKKRRMIVSAFTYQEELIDYADELLEKAQSDAKEYSNVNFPRYGADVCTNQFVQMNQYAKYVSSSGNKAQFRQRAGYMNQNSQFNNQMKQQVVRTRPSVSQGVPKNTCHQNSQYLFQSNQHGNSYYKANEYNNYSPSGLTPENQYMDYSAFTMTNGMASEASSTVSAISQHSPIDFQASNNLRNSPGTKPTNVIVNSEKVDGSSVSIPSSVLGAKMERSSPPSLMSNVSTLDLLSNSSSQSFLNSPLLSNNNLSGNGWNPNSSYPASISQASIWGGSSLGSVSVPPYESEIDKTVSKISIKSGSANSGVW